MHFSQNLFFLLFEITQDIDHPTIIEGIRFGILYQVTFHIQFFNLHVVNDTTYTIRFVVIDVGVGVVVGFVMIVIVMIDIISVVVVVVDG